MPRIKLKNSVVAAKAPLPADLEVGELALNCNNTSPAAYIKDDLGAIVQIAGSGNVAEVWERDDINGTLSPSAATDDVLVGGLLGAPNITLASAGTVTAKSFDLDALDPLP